MRELPTITYAYSPADEALRGRLNEALARVSEHFRPRWDALDREYRDLHHAEAWHRSHSIRTAEEAARAPFLKALVDIETRAIPLIHIPSEINLQGPDVA